MTAIQVEGVTAIVTGANRGIGRALLVALLARGAAKVYAAARRPGTLAELGSLDERVVPIQLDVTVTADVRSAALMASDRPIADQQRRRGRALRRESDR